MALPQAFYRECRFFGNMQEVDLDDSGVTLAF
jgi:hypothetical protein